MKLKQFQKFDLARIAMHDGSILAWDTGLGKGWALILFCLLKSGFEKTRPLRIKKPCLIVAPGDLHDQVRAEARQHFGIYLTSLDSQETFLRLSTLQPDGSRSLPPCFYITSYTDLASNGKAKFPEIDPANPLQTMAELGLTMTALEDFWKARAEIYSDEYETLEANPDWNLTRLEAHARAKLRNCPDHMKHGLEDAFLLLRFLHPVDATLAFTVQPLDFRASIAKLLCGRKHKEFMENNETTRWQNDTESARKIKCCFSPALADLCRESFHCVVVDEGVKMKGLDTIIGKGLRLMDPPHRLVLSATPIKNRLPDVWPLAHWAAGGKQFAHARFPYDDSAEAAQDFANEHMVSERNVSKEEDSDSGRRYRKLTPQVCNVHRVWKIFAPNILRRRKKDIGEAIVQKHRHVVRVPMGQAQAQTYQYHLSAKYLDVNRKPALGAQLQALRQAACAPQGTNLQEVSRCEACDRREREAESTDRGRLVPVSQEVPEVPVRHEHHDGCHCFRSDYSYIPKTASVLTLIQQMMARGEQVLVGSAFNEPLDVLSARLNESGVNHLLLDGRTSQARRGKLAAIFKRGRAGGVPVLLAGVECMAEGYSFNLCKNAILCSYSWAFDKFEQFINRIHRLNSPEDVHAWSVICEGSIDRKLEAMTQEKGDSAELVLDGHLLGENPAEVNLAELLQVAAREFDKDTNTIDERKLLADWPQLRKQLAESFTAWKSGAIITQAEVAAPIFHPVAADVGCQPGMRAPLTNRPIPKPSTINHQLSTRRQPSVTVEMDLALPAWHPRTRRTNRLVAA